MCQNCWDAKIRIQRSAKLMMDIYGLRPASGICLDCKRRPATCRDHRHYSKPLEVVNVCSPCNLARGYAEDLFELIKRHRGVIPPDSKPLDEPKATPEIAPRDLTAHMLAVERGLIESALIECRHNRTAAARRLGISFRAMRYRMEKLGITL